MLDWPGTDFAKDTGTENHIDEIREALEDETIENILQEPGMIKEGGEAVMDGKIGFLFRLGCGNVSCTIWH